MKYYEFTILVPVRVAATDEHTATDEEVKAMVQRLIFAQLVPGAQPGNTINYDLELGFRK